MKMTMVLLVATVALLVSVDAAALDMSKGDNRNKIIDLTDQFNESSFKQEEFVADVAPLAGECGSKFFCKVTDILDNNKTLSTWPEKKALVENLKMYNKQERVNCTEMLKDVQSNGVKIRMGCLMEHLQHCMRKKNWTKKSKP